jgi:hypothetical protein
VVEIYDPAKTCFVIMPFGEKKDANGDPINFEDSYYLIKKGIVGADLRPIRSDEITQAGSIHRDMFAHILHDAAAVVDITSLNPNVFYELGIRHSMRRNVTVLVRKKGTKSPFNIAGLRLIEYDHDIKSADRAIEQISESLRIGLQSSQSDSQIHDLFPNLRVELS